MELMEINNNLTMSSREIADLTKKEHRNVLSDIRNMFIGLEIDSAKFSAQYKDSTGRSLPEFNLDKELTMTLVAGYNVKLRHAIVKRWQELEAKEQKKQIVLPNFTDPIEAATAWIEQYKEKTEALKQLEVAKPKAEFVDKYVERNNLKSVTDVAKEMGISGKVLGAWLREKGHAWTKHKSLRWTQPFMDAGYGEVKKFTSDSGYDGTQALITAKGDVFIKKMYASQD